MLHLSSANNVPPLDIRSSSSQNQADDGYHSDFGGLEDNGILPSDSNISSTPERTPRVEPPSPGFFGSLTPGRRRVRLSVAQNISLDQLDPSIHGKSHEEIEKLRNSYNAAMNFAWDCANKDDKNQKSNQKSDKLFKLVEQSEYCIPSNFYDGYEKEPVKQNGPYALFCVIIFQLSNAVSTFVNSCFLLNQYYEYQNHNQNQQCNAELKSVKIIVAINANTTFWGLTALLVGGKTVKDTRKINYAKTINAEYDDSKKLRQLAEKIIIEQAVKLSQESGMPDLIARMFAEDWLKEKWYNSFEKFNNEYLKKLKSSSDNLEKEVFVGTLFSGLSLVSSLDRYNGQRYRIQNPGDQNNQKLRNQTVGQIIHIVKNLADAESLLPDKNNSLRLNHLICNIRNFSNDLLPIYAMALLFKGSRILNDVHLSPDGSNNNDQSHHVTDLVKLGLATQHLFNEREKKLYSSALFGQIKFKNSYSNEVKEDCLRSIKSGLKIAEIIDNDRHAALSKKYLLSDGDQSFALQFQRKITDFKLAKLVDEFTNDEINDEATLDSYQNYKKKLGDIKAEYANYLDQSAKGNAASYNAKICTKRIKQILAINHLVNKEIEYPQSQFLVSEQNTHSLVRSLHGINFDVESARVDATLDLHHHLHPCRSIHHHHLLVPVILIHLLTHQTLHHKQLARF